MTAEQLEALSKAATQGEWAHTFRGGDSSEGDISCGEHSILTVNGGNYAQWRDAPDGGEAEFKENGDLAAELVNLYRAGQLVMVDDEAVERVGVGIAKALYGPDFDPFSNAEMQDFCEQLATAAIAAMGGK